MDREGRLGELEHMVLLAVWRLEEEAYGGRVRDELERRADRDLTLSAVYLTLVRLEEKGFLASSLGGARPVRGGKAKRLFRVTSSGVEALRDTRDRLERMWEGLDPQRERTG